MHEIEVKIVETPVYQLFLAAEFDFVILMESVPEFGDDEQFFSFYEAVFDCSCYALAGFDFVSVVLDVS